MHIFDELESLVTGGFAATETPTQLATPAASEPVSAVTTIPEEPAVVSSVPVSSQEAIELDDLGQDPKRPVDPAEEERTDLPQRSRQRIAFLLLTYEAGRMDLTHQRIENDRARYLMAQPVKNTDKQPNRNPQAHLADPTAVVPSMGTWRV